MCIDYRKLNVMTVTNTFPLPFTDGALDVVASHEIYNFLEGFSGYNQIRMHPIMIWQDSNACPYVIWVELLTIIPSIIIHKILFSFKFYYRKLMYIPDFSGTF